MPNSNSGQETPLLNLPSQLAATGTVINSTNGTLNATFAIPTNGAQAILVQLDQTTTVTAGAIRFQVSYDNTNFVNMSTDAVIDPTSATNATISLPYTLQASTNKTFLLLMKGAQALQILVSTAMTGSGTITPYYAQLGYDPVQQIAGTVTVSVSGTATVAGNKTNNNAAPGATNVGALVAIANAAVQTWTEGNEVLLSTDLSGNLRTSIPSAFNPVYVSGASVNDNGVAGTSNVITYTPTAGNAIVVTFTSDTAISAVTCKDNNNNLLTAHANNPQGAAPGYQYTFYGLAVAGATSYTIGWTTSAANSASALSEYTQARGFGNVGHTTNFTPGTTIAVTTTATLPSSLIVGGFSFFKTPAASQGFNTITAPGVLRNAAGGGIGTIVSSITADIPSTGYNVSITLTANSASGALSGQTVEILGAYLPVAVQGTVSDNLTQVAGVTLGATAVVNFGTAPAGVVVPAVNASIFKGTAAIAANNALNTTPGDGTNAMGTMSNFGTTPTGVKALVANVSVFYGTAAPSASNTDFNQISDGTNAMGAMANFGTSPTGVKSLNTNASIFVGTTAVRTNQTTTATGVVDVNIVGSLGVTNSVSNGTFIAITDNTTKVGVIVGTTALKTDNSSIAGTATVTAAAGVQKVGIVGNANAALDAALGTAPTNALGASLFPVTSGGCTTAVSQALTSSINVKNSAGQLYGYTIFNPNAGTVYVFWYNTTTVPGTIGSTTNLLYQIGIPTGSAAHISLDNGVAFSTGIAVAVSTSATSSAVPGTGLTITTLYK